MKTKADFYLLCDKYKELGSLPSGRPFSKQALCNYLHSAIKEGFKSPQYGTKMSEYGLRNWFNDWYHERNEKNVEPLIISKQEITELPESELADKIKKLMHKRKDVCSLEGLSNQFDCSIGKIRIAITELQEKGFTIELDNDTVVFNSEIPKNESTILNVNKMSTGLYRFGVLGDNHLCSKYERLDVLNALYDYYVECGIEVVYNTGNWIDGEARFNKHDLHTHGMDNQIRYFLDNYPKREGIETRYITGDDHEGWYTQREGINIGKYTEHLAVEAGRNDLKFLGHMEHDEIIKMSKGETRLRVLHPGGGSSYATSYSVQKIVESYTGGDKPDILFCGHYHKAEYTYYRGVHIVQTATTEDQSPFMRKKKLAAHLGGWVIEFANDEIGAVTKFKSEFIPFYDKQYYKDNWNYKW